MPDAQPDAEGKSPRAKSNAPRRRALPVVTENRLFLLLILIVTGSLGFGLLGLAALAMFGKEPPTTLQSKFADVCVYICMVSIGTLVGLLGGRASAPDRLELAEKPK